MIKNSLSCEAIELFNNLPKSLKYHLLTFFQRLQSELPACCSVVLIGSSARDELTWLYDKKKLKVIGDVEFIIFTEKYSKARITEITNNIIKEWALKDYKNFLPLELDFGILNRMSLYFGVKGIWRFEVQKSGILVFGRENPFSATVPVTACNIDLASVNYLIMVRLWSSHSAIRKKIMNEKTTPSVKELKAVYLRNILDALTIYLPREKVLVCGYKNRLEAYKLLPENNILFEYQEALKIATQWKISGVEAVTLQNLMSDFINVFKVINKTKYAHQKTSLAFFIRSKIMIYKMQKGYFQRNPFLSFVNTLLQSHDYVESNIIAILFHFHDNLLQRLDQDNVGTETQKVQSHFADFVTEKLPDSAIDIMKNKFLEDELNFMALITQNLPIGVTEIMKNEFLEKELSSIMDFWFYGRSVRKL